MIWKTSQNLQITQQGVYLCSHPEVFPSDDVLKNFVKFTINIFARFSFSIKLQAGNLKLSEAATGDVLSIRCF